MYVYRGVIIKDTHVKPVVNIPAPSRIYIRKPGNELQTGIILTSAPANGSEFVSFASQNGHLLAAELETIRDEHDFEVKTYDLYIQRKDDLGLKARLEPPQPDLLKNPMLTHFHFISPKHDYDLVGALQQTTSRPSWATFGVARNVRH
ncbi:uncharacterized protein LOC117173743 [Belonocnema kinseyi]|uniref:uncharacterized protein LOC117173743 n=1 Tax=Belonocnema kinseyi TaxID=2817044 RepID=UPI00143D4F95|nr:uncharacterized protein LOC117173743 [Belonocnema kinseyi]